MASPSAAEGAYRAASLSPFTPLPLPLTSLFSIFGRWSLRLRQKQSSPLLLFALLSILSSWSLNERHLCAAQQLLFEPNPHLTHDHGPDPWSAGGITPEPNGYTRGPSRCYNDQLVAQRCVPPFVNAAFNQLVEATNTCGNPPIEYCRQTGVTGNERLNVVVAIVVIVDGVVVVVVVVAVVIVL